MKICRIKYVVVLIIRFLFFLSCYLYSRKLVVAMSLDAGIVATYIQNLQLIRYYFTIRLVLVASLFIVQNIVIVIFWSNLYMAGPSIKNIVDAAAPYLFVINTAQSAGLAILLWITRRWDDLINELSHNPSFSCYWLAPSFPYSSLVCNKTFRRTVLLSSWNYKNTQFW